MSTVVLDQGLDVAGTGRPDHAVRLLALDALHDAPPEQIAQAAAAIARSPVLTVAIARLRPPPRLTPLVDAATVTLSGPAVAATRQMVTVDDPDAAADAVYATIERNPRCAVALGRLLDQTRTLPTQAGLAAEAAVYSMLLGGTEFATWLATTPRPPARTPVGPPLRVARRDDRLEIVLDRPESRNALTFRMREELYDVLEVALLDPTIDNVHLTGTGSAFCSGGDLSEFGSATDLVAAYLVRIDRAPWELIDRLGKRVHVHVNGHAIGAGLEIAAFAHRVTCVPGATFRLPELGMGLVPGAGGTVSVVRRIGRWRAAWLMLTGSSLDARTARAWGLVDEVTRTGD